MTYTLEPPTPAKLRRNLQAMNTRDPLTVGHCKVSLRRQQSVGYYVVKHGETECHFRYRLYAQPIGKSAIGELANPIAEYAAALDEALAFILERCMQPPDELPTCVVCGKPFAPYRKHQKFCGKSHRITYHSRIQRKKGQKA